MRMRREVNELATEGEHEARITDVKDLGIVKGKFRPERKVQVTFTMLDQEDCTDTPVKIRMQYAAKCGPQSALGKLLDDMGYDLSGGIEFELEHLLVNETVHVNVQHNRDGTFANVTHVVKDPAVTRDVKDRWQCAALHKGGPERCFNSRESGSNFCGEHQEQERYPVTGTV
jgi:hypothetical protein